MAWGQGRLGDRVGKGSKLVGVVFALSRQGGRGFVGMARGIIGRCACGVVFFQERKVRFN